MGVRVDHVPDLEPTVGLEHGQELVGLESVAAGDQQDAEGRFRRQHRVRDAAGKEREESKQCSHGVFGEPY